MKTKDWASSLVTLADQRQVRVTCSTGGIDLVGDIIDQDGIDLANFRANPIVLWGHDHDVPIARALTIGVVQGKLQALVQFPDPGVSAKADEVYGLIKAGIVNTTSIGILPVHVTKLPAGEGQRKGGDRYVKSVLMEFSFVAVPANPGALISERSGRQRSDDEARARRLRMVEVLELSIPPLSSAERAAAKRKRMVEVLELSIPPLSSAERAERAAAKRERMRDVEAIRSRMR